MNNVDHMKHLIQLVEYRVYSSGEKPSWYEEAVQLKTDNPHMNAVEIGRQVNVHSVTVLRWLAGVPNSDGSRTNDNPPFTQKDFPNESGRKYFDGAKPDWYEQAIELRKQGMPYTAIANELSTPQDPIGPYGIRNWLIKGKKAGSGNLINPDAPFTPKVYNTTKIDIALLKELILDRYTDEQIIELIADEKGDKMASEVKNMLPVLRKKLNPGTQVLNKQTGDDLTGFVQSK